jgi:hypothetical protein
LSGTSGNDTFVADNTTGTNAQTGAADTVNGGAGTDTLKVFLATAGAIDAFNMPGLTSVENIYINNGALTTTKTLDVSTKAGVTSLELDSQAAMATGETFTIKQAATQTLKLDKLNVATGVAATLKLDGVTSVTLNAVGTDTTNNGALTLDLVSTGTALTLNGATAASKITLADTGAKLATLTITGDKAITVSENIATLLKIDASAATAAVKVDTSAGTAPTTLAFTGGAANDVLTEKGAAIVKTQVLDGGAGTADMLVISDANTTAFATVATGVNAAAKNFEVLGFAGTVAVAADVSLITAMTQFDVTGAINTTGAAGAAGAAGTGATAAVAFTGEGNAQSFIVDANISAVGGAGGAHSTVDGSSATGGAGAAGAIALNIAPLIDNGANAVTITLNGVTLSSSGGAGGAATVAAGATADTATGGAAGNAAVTVSATAFETVNIVSNGAATDTTTLTANAFVANAGAVGVASGATTTNTNGAAGTAAAGLDVGTNATVNVTGASDLNTGLITGANVTVNAGAFTGKLTLATSTGNDTIVGGSGVNTITLNGGVDTIDLSKSVAKVDVVNVNAVSGLDATASKFVTITGFTSAATTGDKLDIVGTNTAHADVAAGALTGVTNLTASVTNGIVAFAGTAAATATFANLISATFSTNVLGATANKEVAFQYGGDTYVAVELSGAAGYTAGTDLVIKLVGVTGATAIADLSGASAANTIFVG